MVRAFICLLLLTSTAAAQDIPFTALDQDLWKEMSRALGDVPMSINAHQQVQNILQGVQREAGTRAMRAKAMQAPPLPAEPKN